MQFCMDKDIPIPRARCQTTGLPDLMRSMEVGDSFRLPEGVAPQTARTVAFRLKPMGFSRRRTMDGGFRIWRVR